MAHTGNVLLPSRRTMFHVHAVSSPSPGQPHFCVCPCAGSLCLLETSCTSLTPTPLLPTGPTNIDRNNVSLNFLLDRTSADVRGVKSASLAATGSADAGEVCLGETLFGHFGSGLRRARPS